MQDYDIRCTNAGDNCHNHPVFKDGALTSNDAKVRQYALQRYMSAIDIAVEVGCSLCNLWWGRDGTEVEASKNPLESIKRLREALNYLQAYIDQQGYQGFRLAMEPKPNEPRGDIFMPTVGHGLALIATLNKPDNCGIVPELAHIRMAGLNCYHEVAQALELDKLYGLHFNGQKPLRYDQDLRFGAEDLKESFFVVKLVEDNHWEGPRLVRRPRLPDGYARGGVGFRRRLHADIPDPQGKGAAVRCGRGDPGAFEGDTRRRGRPAPRPCADQEHALRHRLARSPQAAS